MMQENLSVSYTEPSETFKNKIGLLNEIINKNRPIFIFGTNEYASALAKKFNVYGYINDRSSEKEFLGKPIIKIENIERDSIVISTVVLARPKFAVSKISQYCNNVLDYFFIQKHSGYDLPNVIFSTDQDFTREYSTNFSHYASLYNELCDRESKIVLESIIKFRLTGDLNCLKNFNYCPEKQYFDPCIRFNEDEVFLDVGCFDGYTSMEFIKYSPDFKRIYIFEPDMDNMKTVKQNLNKYTNKITFVNKGLSDSEKTLNFSSSGSSSKISTEGDLKIDVCDLDSIDIIDATYIKMDIEGGEIDALLGAQNTIKKFKPKLAISVYHKIDDLWKIPKIIKSFGVDFDIYLRHYTEGVTETVMYFIPISNGNK